VQAGGGDEGVELSCLVHAYPPAQVDWYRDQDRLPTIQYNLSSHVNTDIFKLSLPPEEARLGKLYGVSDFLPQDILA
jgi:hypothetical protein